MQHQNRPAEDWLVVTAPALFVVLWSSGFIGTKTGVLYAEPMTFLSVRMAAVVVLLGMAVSIAGVFLVNWNGRWSRG